MKKPAAAKAKATSSGQQHVEREREKDKEHLSNWHIPINYYSHPSSVLPTYET